MNRQILIEAAEKQIATLKADLNRWEMFLEKVKSEDIIMLSDGPEPVTSVMQIPQETAPQQIVAPVELADPAPEWPSGKIHWSNLIRQYFVKLKKNGNKQIRSTIAVKEILESSGLTVMEQKINKSTVYGLLGTLEKRKEIKVIRKDRRVFYQNPS